MSGADGSPELLAAGEVRSRAAAGAALLGARGAAVYVLATVANLVLARLLAPADFGVFALGLVLVTVGTYASDGGFGGALIRRERPPLRVELEAVSGLQLGATTLVVLIAAAIAVPLGRTAEVMALMAASLPIALVRAPSVIVLERRLEYRAIAIADLVEAVVFYSVAIALVALGLGVWGMAIAIVARAVVGTTTVIVLGPLGPVRPRWAWQHVRPLLGFGARFQVASVIVIAREQLLNVVIGAVAGLATLGVWSLAWRVIQIPGLLFQTVGRVGFPAMSRLIEAGQDPGPVLERQVATVAAVNAVVVAGVVGFAPALPVLVGHGWGDVPEVLLWSGVALVIAGPVVAAASGYLFAAGEPGRVAAATVVSALAWLAVMVPLLGPLGAPAAGLGWIAAGAVNGWILWRRTARLTSAAILSSSSLPVAIALAALAAGWFAAHVPDQRLLGGVLGVCVAEAIVLAGLLAFSRPAVREVAALTRQALRTLR